MVHSGKGCLSPPRSSSLALYFSRTTNFCAQAAPACCGAFFGELLANRPHMAPPPLRLTIVELGGSHVPFIALVFENLVVSCDFAHSVCKSRGPSYVPVCIMHGECSSCSPSTPQKHPTNGLHRTLTSLTNQATAILLVAVATRMVCLTFHRTFAKQISHACCACDVWLRESQCRPCNIQIIAEATAHLHRCSLVLWKHHDEWHARTSTG